MSAVSFEYGSTTVGSLVVNTAKHPVTQKELVTTVGIGNNTEAIPSKRFWTSLRTRYGISENIFRYFSYKEVLERISAKAKNENLRYCLERREGQTPVLLAVTNPNSPIVRHEVLQDVYNRYGSERTSYSGSGIYTSRHIPRVSEPFSVGGDAFENRFSIDAPVDGFGRPAVYLSLMRVVCANGAIAYSSAFRHEIAIGRSDGDAKDALLRVMDSFNHDEGFAELRERLEAARLSWASVRECNRVYKLLTNLINRGHMKSAGKEIIVDDHGNAQEYETRMPYLQRFHKLTGDLHETYRIANMDNVSVKRQMVLPAKCTMYDLLNFTTELATHHTESSGVRLLHAHFGETVSADYDLPGTAERYPDYQDLFMTDKRSARALQTLHAQAG